MRRKQIAWTLVALFFTASLVSCTGQQVLTEPENAIPNDTPEETHEAAEEEPPEQEVVTTYSEEALWAAYQERANKALEHLLMAQIAMAEGLPNSALYQINLSLAILQTADGLAYKGSILYLLGQHDEARSFWERAYEMDPEAIHINLPGIPEGLD